MRIELVVRDTCRLRPGLRGFSESVRVVSVVGRFLEHARIYYFRNGGNEEYFIGSADSMRRNLEQRVEALVPIEDASGRQALRAMLDIQLTPNRNMWQMESDGSYERAEVDGADRGCQQAFLEWIAARDSRPITRNGKPSRRRFARRPVRPA